MKYECVIGLEVHAELATNSKIFCGCTTRFGGGPNTQVCEICAGMPGSLPVLNKRVVEFAIKTGLATNCDITKYNKFDRKGYFYPDSPKGYQISQLYLPVCRNGYIEIGETETARKIRIHEIHMEEDAGKLVHDEWSGGTLVDYNRCGVPLLEIVSEPDLHSAEETIEYLERLRAILQYTGVSDCKMQEGSFRADINLSVRPVGESKLGTRTEMKNMNSFKAISRAIESERERHIEVLEAGGKLIQETRRWDDNKGCSFAMRSKENAHDYKYFPDPDLPPVSISDETIEHFRAAMPELPQEKKRRYTEQLGLPEYDTNIITGSIHLARLFEATAELCGNVREAANWILGDLLKLLNDNSVLPENMSFEKDSLGKIIIMIEKGIINRGTAKKVFEQVFLNNIDPEKFVEEKGLSMITDTSALLSVVERVIEENPKSVEEYKGGKTKAIQFLIGQSMKALKGKAPAAEVGKLLEELLNK